MLSLLRSFLYLVFGLLALELSATNALPDPNAAQILLSNEADIERTHHDQGTFAREEKATFDIGGYQGDTSLHILEQVKSNAFRHVTGEINIAAGDYSQERDVVIMIRMRSSSLETLNRLAVSVKDQELIIDSSGEGTHQESTAQILVNVFVRPHCLQFDFRGTTVHATHLDIKIWPGLDFETYHMVLISQLGTITGSETNTFTAHEMSIRATTGHIVGNWSLPASIHFNASNGDIDVNLIPKQWSSGPHTLGDLYAETKHGDVAIRMPFERNQLSLRNYTTTIKTWSGDIKANLVHGASTRLLSHGSGSINVTLLPYWSFFEWQGIQFSHLETDQIVGRTDLRILHPIIDDYYPVNPLCLMKSRHKTVTGRMDLSYPSDWCGTANGITTPWVGHVEVSGRDYDVLIEQPEHVVVQRSPLGSTLDFEIVHGTAHLELN